MEDTGGKASNRKKLNFKPWKFYFVQNYTMLTIVMLPCLQAYKRYSYVRPNKQLFYNRGCSYEHLRYQWSNNDGIPGEAERDYPIFNRVSSVDTIHVRMEPGYYTDPEADCQAYHICQRGGRKDSFLCPNGTLFNQKRLVCTWWYTVDCSRAQSFYSINEAIAKAMKEADR